MSINSLVSENLHRLRQQKGWSLDKTAKATGVSKPMLSQIERGESSPTVSTLWKIAAGFGVPFTAFLEENQPSVSAVQHSGVEPLLEAYGSFKVRCLFPMEEYKKTELYEVELLPGCIYDSAPHGEGVEEFVLSKSGAAIIAIHDEEYLLTEDQSLRFNAHVPHRYENRTDRSCFLHMVITYP